MRKLHHVAKLLTFDSDKTSKAPRDLLLSLHLDIFEELVDHLPLQSLLFLSQTCSSLRNVLRRHLWLRALRVSDRELLECLTVAAQACPDAWACQQCIAIHDVDYRDTPHRRALACRRLHYTPLLSGPQEGSYELHHHHVQLALKYSRLEHPTREQTEYLQQLLAPHTSEWFRINPDCAGGNRLSATYTVTPRIVKERYVRKCTWNLSGQHIWSFHDKIGGIALCCHLRTTPMPGTESGRVARHRHSSQLDTVISYAIESDRIAASGHCYYCALDFRVTVTLQGKGLMVEAWQDLGPEGSVYEANWRAMAWDSRRYSIVQHIGRNKIVTSRWKLVWKLYEG